MKDNRIEQLDSIRGLASLTVFFNHMYLVIPFLPLIFERSPLKILVNGHGAVILFFMLSGFVLSLPFFKGKEYSYMPYLIKRIFRIYLPYLFAMAVAITACLFLANGKIPALSGWFNLFWNQEPDSKLIMEHIGLIGNIHTNAFNTVIWSLVHEVRVSLIFPFILPLLNRQNWVVSLMLCLFLSSIKLVNDIFHFQSSNGLHSSYFDTAHFLSIFMMGALAAKHRGALISFYKRIPAMLKWFLFICALMMYAYYDLVGNSVPWPYGYILKDYDLAISSGIFIIISLASATLKKWLSIKPVVFLGKISYSLYLYHVTILLSLIHAFYGTFPLWLLDLAALALAVAAGYAGYRFVEEPCMVMGKNVSKKVRKTGIRIFYQEGVFGRESK